MGPARPNGKSRMHGGMSTGLRTPENVEKCKKANWKRGYYFVDSLLRYAMHSLREIGEAYRRIRLEIGLK